MVSGVPVRGQSAVTRFCQAPPHTRRWESSPESREEGVGLGNRQKDKGQRCLWLPGQGHVFPGVFPFFVSVQGPQGLGGSAPGIAGASVR